MKHTNKELYTQKLQNLDKLKRQDFDDIVQSLGRDKYVPEQLIEAVEAIDSDASRVLIMIVGILLVFILSIFLVVATSNPFFGVLIIASGCLSLLLLIVRGHITTARTGSGAINGAYVSWVKYRAKYGFWGALLLKGAWVVLVFIFALLASILITRIRNLN